MSYETVWIGNTITSHFRQFLKYLQDIYTYIYKLYRLISQFPMHYRTDKHPLWKGVDHVKAHGTYAYVCVYVCLVPIVSSNMVDIPVLKTNIPT